MRRILTILLLWLGVSGAVLAQNVVTDLSEREIDIRYSFNGANLLLFGAVNEGKMDPSIRTDIIVVVRGPNEEIIVREKQRMFGIWVNQDVHRFGNAPGFYAVATSRPLADIDNIDQLNARGIGYLSLGLDQDSHEEHAENFRIALVRSKERAGLYSESEGGVSVVGGGLFRADVQLPANVPVGDFTVETFVYQSGRLLGHKLMSLNVDKAGFERAVYAFAHNQPFWYGIVAVLIALAAGWLAGLASRK